MDPYSSRSTSRCVPKPARRRWPSARRVFGAGALEDAYNAIKCGLDQFEFLANLLKVVGGVTARYGCHGFVGGGRDVIQKFLGDLNAALAIRADNHHACPTLVDGQTLPAMWTLEDDIPFGEFGRFFHLLCHTDLLWGVVLEDSGQVVFIPNPKIRVATNYSEGISSEKIELKKAPWE